MDRFSTAYSDAKVECDSTGRWDALRDLTCDAPSVMALAEKHPREIKYLLWIRQVPFEALDLMARIGDDEDKIRIASKYPLLRETYEFLSGESDEIKVRLFANRKLPKDISDKLLNDPSEFVRRETARWRDWKTMKGRTSSPL